MSASLTHRDRITKWHCVKSDRIWSYSGPNAGKNGPE